MKRLSDYVERKLSYSRKMGATLDSAKDPLGKVSTKVKSGDMTGIVISNSTSAMAYDDFSISGISGLSLVLNRYWGIMAKASEERVNAKSLLQGTAGGQELLDELRGVFKKHASDTIARISDTARDTLPNMDIVVWTREQALVATMGHEQLVDARIMMEQIPLEPQLWMYDAGGIPGIEITSSVTDIVTIEDIEAILLLPIHISTDDELPKLSTTPTNVLGSLFAGVITRSKGKLRLIWMPILSYYAKDDGLSKYDEFLVAGKEATQNISDIHPDIQIAADEYGAILRVCSGELASTIVASMLYMQESYVDTTPERVRVRGVDRRGAKPKEHSSDVLVVKIRKKLTNKNHQDMGESGINYTCQWAVRPHWRRYTKPLKNGSFVTRVPGYVKGPEGMPMKAKTRIFEVVQ